MLGKKTLLNIKKMSISIVGDTHFLVSCFVIKMRIKHLKIQGLYRNYNTTQLSLEVNLAYDIPITHESRIISLFVNSITGQVLMGRSLTLLAFTFIQLHS